MAYELTGENKEIRISPTTTQVHCDTPPGTGVRVVVGAKQYAPFTFTEIEVSVGGEVVHRLTVFTGPGGHANVTLKDIEVAS